jgi:hypothetical protein
VGAVSADERAANGPFQVNRSDSDMPVRLPLGHAISGGMARLSAPSQLHITWAIRTCAVSAGEWAAYACGTRTRTRALTGDQPGPSRGPCVAETVTDTARPDPNRISESVHWGFLFRRASPITSPPPPPDHPPRAVCCIFGAAGGVRGLGRMPTA